MRERTHSELIVVGGGMAGVAAATAAARLGADVLLMERFGFLGGWATAALVNPFMTHCASDGTPLVGGLYAEIRDRLGSAGGLMGNSFDSELMKLVLDEMVLGSGARLRLHTFFETASFGPDGRITVSSLSKSGREQFTCARLVDCSGDGDAAAALGAQFESGDDQGLTQAVTLMFDMGGVDLERALEYVRDHPDQVRFPKLTPDADLSELASGVVSVAGYYSLVAEARDRGEYECPGDLIFYISRPHRGEVTFNTTHVGMIDGTNADDLTRAEIEGRHQMASVAAFVKKYVPGFENAYLVRTAAHVGVRETRRVTGEYVFGAEDVTQARKFDDAVCRLAYPVDVHSGKGTGYTKDEEKQRAKAPPPGDWYEIPYRCLVPVGVENVLTAGRCISSTQEGHGAIRIMPSCAATGEAAGTAAALSMRSGCSPAQIDGKQLRSVLRERGAIL